MIDKPTRRKKKTWDDIFNKWLAKGHDHASAAVKADEWERTVAMKARRTAA